MPKHNLARKLTEPSTNDVNTIIIIIYLFKIYITDQF